MNLKKVIEDKERFVNYLCEKYKAKNEEIVSFATTSEQIKLDDYRELIISLSKEQNKVLDYQLSL